MRLKVKNFGPVNEADIEIKPLTVIIGKNNAGKSMLAQLIFTLMTLMEGRPPERIFLSLVRRMRMRGLIYLPILSPLTFKIEDFDKRMENVKEVTPHSFIETFIKTVLDNTAHPLENTLKNLLERNFGVELKNLINLYSDFAEIECTYSEYLKMKIIIAQDNSLSVDLDVKVEELANNILKDAKIRRLIKEYIASTEERKILRIFPLIEKVAKFIFPERALLSTLYIPAGRAGLLEGYEAVSSALIALAPAAPLRGISMPPMPGMASEFYSIMLQLGGRKGPFAEMAELFREIMEGDIYFEMLEAPKGKSKMVYKFKFKDKEASIDLIHAASMIKELAPIYLVVREFVDKGYLLIIEEPESHLHPAAQIKLVEIFAKLVNKGLNIIMTTHSDLLLRKLAHLVMRSSIKSKSDVILNPEDVSIYLLKPNEKGYVTQKVNILEEMPTFDEVINQLYEEERSLYFSLEGKD